MSGETGLPTRWTVIRTGPLGRQEIIEVAGGPASVNAEMQVRGKRVVAVDPLYSFSPAEIDR